MKKVSETKLPSQLNTTAIAEDVNRLHQEALQAAKHSVEKAIEAGRMLARVRAALPHGEWLPWCSRNLAFSDRTARNYINVFESGLKLETVSSLGEAYSIISVKADGHRKSKRCEVQKLSVDLDRVVFGAYIHVADALIAIRDQRLYRGTHATFDDYCRDRWGFVGDQGERLLGLAEEMRGIIAATREVSS